MNFTLKNTIVGKDGGMKIFDKRGDNPSKKSASSMTIGIVFTGQIGGHKGVFMRILDHVVSLTDPTKLWSVFGGPAIYVENFVEVEAELSLYNPSN